MPVKNYTRTKPTGGWYWYKNDPAARAKHGFVYYNTTLFSCEGIVYYVVEMTGWWAKVEPPVFDGEDGE